MAGVQFADLGESQHPPCICQQGELFAGVLKLRGRDVGPPLQQAAGAAGQINHVRRGDGAATAMSSRRRWADNHVRRGDLPGITLRRVSHHPELRSRTLKPSSWSFANRATCCTVDDPPQLYPPFEPLVLDHGLGAAEQGEARCTIRD